jgi:hypothetical protein
MINQTFSEIIEPGHNAQWRIQKVVQHYGRSSTIAGLHYAFDSDQSIVGRTIWLLSVSVLASLGFYFSVQNYQQWQNEPVVTTLTSTGDVGISFNLIS